MKAANFSKDDQQVFFAEYESSFENPAFINDFIDICWIDPWSPNPARPVLKKNKTKNKSV